MAKLVLIVLVIAAVVGGGYFFLNYEIQRGTPSGWKIVPRNAGAGGGARGVAADPPPALLGRRCESPRSNSAGSTRPSWPAPRWPTCWSTSSRSSIWWPCRACGGRTKACWFT